MTTEKIVVSDQGHTCDGLDAALDMVARTATDAGFAQQEVSTLRHLAEEMIVGSASILVGFSGTMWVQTDEALFQILLQLKGLFSQTERDAFVALTRENENTLPPGFFHRLAILLGDALTGEYAYTLGMPGEVENGELLWGSAQIAEMMADMERHSPEDTALQQEAKQQLDTLADDVTVCATSGEVLITVSKAWHA